MFKSFSILFLSLLVGLTVQAKEWNLMSSKAEFLAKHLAHNTHGETKNAKGKLKCQTECDALIAIAVNTFETGNTNRNLHMMKVVKAGDHPYVTLRLKGPASPMMWNKNNLKAEIEFAGVTKPIKFNSFEVKETGNSLKTSSKFSITLTSFNVERPSLLGVSVDDNVELEVVGEWKSVN